MPDQREFTARLQVDMLGKLEGVFFFGEHSLEAALRS